MVKKTKTKKKQKTESLLQTEKETLRISKEKLAAIADEWRTTFDAIKDAVSIINVEGSIIRCNRAMADLLSKPFPEIIGRKCWELMHGSTKPIPECPIVRMKKSMKRETLTLPLMGRWFEGTADPIIDKRGKLAGAVHIIVDITKSKRIEEILEKERQELKLIIDSSPIIVFYKDKEGKFIRVNKTFAEAIKMPEEEFVGKTVFDLYSAKIAQGMTNDDHEVLKSGRPKLNIIEQYESASGIRWVQTDKIPICDKNGIPVGLIGFAQDITERKQAEEALQESEEKYRNLTETLDELIYRADPETFVATYVNRAVERIYGYTVEEWLSKPTIWEDTIYPEDKGKVFAEFAEGRRKAVSGAVEYRIIRKDKSIRWVVDRFNWERNQQGDEVSLHGVMSDITDRKRAEEALRKGKEFSDGLIASMKDGFSVLDSQGVHIDVNAALCQMTGFSREELIGVGPPHPYWPPEEYKKIEEAFRKTLRGEFADFELIFMRKNGERFPAIVSPSHIKDKQGNIINYFATIKDITERRQAEEEIIRGKLLSDSIVNNIPAGIAFLDNDFILRQCNRVYADLIRKYTPYTPEQALGMSYFDYVPDSQAQVEEWFQKVRDLAQVETKYGFELTIKRDGQDEKTYWDTSVAPVLDPAGKVEGILILTQDVTEHKRLEEQVRDTHEMKIFGQLAAGVAHEVRNPLNAILALTEALFQDIGDNPEYLPYLEHIHNEVDRLSTLMKDLLEIGKPISQDSFQPETVARIVTSTIDLWGMIDLLKRHALRFISHPESEKLFVKTDIARFQQVVLNLLQNASQNSPEGSEIVIQVFEPGDKTVNVHIIDRGTGIPPDNLKHVFEPFFTTRKGGTGLGLSLVKNFVESMGGKVAIWDNDPPPGCTVELSLPIATDSES